MLRRFVDRLRRRSADEQSAPPPAPRNYAQEREDRRLGQLSEEDKAWGEASRQRDQELREARERDQTPPGTG
jgi:hypothetical protein